MIDQERLKELAEDFGEDDLADLIEVFVAETWEALDELGKLLSEEQGNARREQFHFLKGCARNLGATEFADRCEVLERSDDVFAEGDFQALRGQFQAVEDYFNSGGLRLSA